MCQFPVSIKNEKPVGTLLPRNPWPICTQPTCKCLGTDDVGSHQHLPVLRFSCSDNFVTFSDVKGNAYIVPKRYNCGSFQPTSSTFANRCECPNIGKRKQFKLY